MAKRVILLTCLFSLCLLFSGLGYWQLERRDWKLDLIAHVEHQLRQSPVPAPGPEAWQGLTERDAYRRVSLTGRYQHEAETRVQAMTRHGSGYWLLTPMIVERGFTVLVNRGFVDLEHKRPKSRQGRQPADSLTITGLLRLSEPEGRLFQDNRPGEDRWYSRDVAAIGAARDLDAARLAPYFVDAAASASSQQWPIAGLTVTRQRNAHLVYAITWFALAVMCLIGMGIVLRAGRRDVINRN